MSAHIGTNFSLQSNEFLDSRQGQALNKTDLLNWKTPVPDGFEICLENEWYYYDSKENLPLTGHWVPRVYRGENKLLDGQSISAKYLKSLQDKVDSLEQLVRSLSIKFNLVHIIPTFENIFRSEEILNKTKLELGILIEISIDQLQKQENVEEELFKFSDLNRDGKLDQKDSQELLNRFDRLDFIFKDHDYYKNAIIDKGIYEVGSQIFPCFKLGLGQDGEKIDDSKIDKYNIDSVGEVDFCTLPEDSGPLIVKNKVYPNGLLSNSNKFGTIRIPIRAFLKTGQVVYDEVKYKFLANIYWGMSEIRDLVGGLPYSNAYKIDYTKIEELGFSSRLSENYDIDSELTCVSGKTPIVILPIGSIYYKMIPKIFINDTLIDDSIIWEQRFDIRNSKGLDISYIAYGISNFTFENPTIKLKVITDKRQ